ncbi:NAD(P)H-dependent oxidoreductase [Pseudonocardia aurantiaca]|uniref:FMN dependent NADH:quinone oxidoreductase n=1 Tax=Pseudonocardia aurantiaca TaxID=75290 RepID=A0ABW4FYF6_9PSEU
MTLFRLDASIRREGSVSREVADTVQRSWIERHPHDTVIHRDLTASPLAADAWLLAASTRGVPEDEQTPEQRAAVTLTALLANEVLNADALLIATPLYNFGISQHLKTWIDLLAIDPRFVPGPDPLAGRPVTLVIARGGGYGEGTPRAGWDHATPYLEQTFGAQFGGDVTVVAAELTLADVTPQMAELRGLAAELRTKAHELAAETGRVHAELVASRRADAGLTGAA